MSRVTRRQFLQIGGAVLAVGAVPKGVVGAMEMDMGGRAFNYYKVAVDRKKTAYTVSPFSKLKTPQQVFLENGQVVSSTGFLNHPATRGRSSAIDTIAHLTASDPDRLLYPLKREGKRGENRWKKISWQEALDEIGKAVKDATAKNGAASIWLVRGEDSPDGAWKRYMHTLGSPSVVSLAGDDSKKAGQSLTWGEEMEVPDFANARYILNFGSNIFETFPAYAAAVADGRAERHAKLVTFDPRMSMTAGLSDEWVPVLPGTDGIVALAMANVIMQEGLADTAFINAWTNIPADKLAKHLSQFTPEMAEKESGIKADVIKRIAIEFATEKPATVFSYGGASSHTNGTDTERACMLLPIITGNVEVKGGYCLPRRIQWDDVKPVPPVPAKQAADTKGALFPHAAKSGKANVGVLFNYNTNPAHSAAAAPYWREALKDEKAVPFLVSIGTHMSETAALADIVLPDATYLESNEPVSSPSSLFPWLGVRTVVSKAPGEVRELKVILRDIVHTLDKEGSQGMKQYWDFQDAEEWLGKCVDSIPALKADGGLGTLKDNGLWPSYGTLDSKTGKVLDKDGKPLKAEYGKYKKAGFATASKKIEIHSEPLQKRGLSPLPTWQKAGNLAVAQGKEKESFAFITFKTAYQGGLAAENNKYLAEKDHQNHCLINKKTATAMGIKDGDLVRVTSPAGYIVTRVRATQSIHPQVVAMAGGHGHSAIGRVAQMEPRHKPEWVASAEDRDVRFNLWWDDKGVNPNEIMPLFADPASGSAATSFVVNVEKARDGDNYGDIKTDAALHEAFFKKAAESL
ncbi:MAG: molybdopterin-dependent oxidoreductase [Nitrosomonadales bacterium]|nr:molybdopterin-dependent oxidoreductase [Nitrosomonadales bacterium]